ncbi:uncharacterized protein LOC112573429 isoform X2 [Pomacea canaliculata]|uniref:uncharacterized protein LOC112573429 isoform X2 n=1 Tax=Pomacea canaliculata TaxID=400727 RepID=UPI000D72FC9A|nr:uncharacterized protein LOC112573429 isoform X2 [Pomacea canaliculata]
MASYTSRNGFENAHLYLTRLLQDTQPPSRWQHHLRTLLSIYIQHNDAKQALLFLMNTMNTAMLAVQDHSTCPGYPSLFINMRSKPSIFPIDAWKHILLSLHFDLTEPEGNRDLDLIEVNVTANVTLPLLQGFTLILQSLLGLDWGMLRMLLAIDADDGLRLLSSLQDVVVQSSHIEDIEILLQLYARYPDELSALGFSYRSKVRPQMTWQRPENDDVSHMIEVALLGLFHDGSGLEVFI